MIGENSIRMADKYLQKVIALKRPKSKAAIRSYSSLLGWLNKCIFGLKKAMQPIARMARKNVKLDWGINQETAFLLIQQLLSEAKPLVPIDWNNVKEKPLVVITDASDYAYGAAFLQLQDDGKTWSPIEFLSRSWKGPEENWAPSTKAFVAIVHAVQK